MYEWRRLGNNNTPIRYGKKIEWIKKLNKLDGDNFWGKKWNHDNLKCLLNKIERVVHNRNLLAHMMIEENEENNQAQGIVYRGPHSKNVPVITDDFLVGLFEECVECMGSINDFIELNFS